jgi:hypothetical protein
MLYWIKGNEIDLGDKIRAQMSNDVASLTIDALLILLMNRSKKAGEKVVHAVF